MIPGVTYHPRASWQDPRYPISGPKAKWEIIDRPIAHYTADDDLIDGDPGESADDLPGYLRAMQRSYAKPVGDGGRGYSVGYMFAIDWLGGVWELRGFDFQSAANKGDPRKTDVRNINPWTAPILFLVDGQDRATDEAVNAAKFVLAEMRRRASRPLQPLEPHSSVDFTQCCGLGIKAQIAAGVFAGPPIVPRPPDPPKPPPVQPPDDQEFDDMKPTLILEDTRLRGTFALVGGRWVSYPVFPNGYPDGVQVVSIDHEWTRAQILHDQGPEGAELWRERGKLD